MYEFKKTDSKELERTITIVLAAVMITLHLVNFLQQIKIIDLGRIEAGSIALPVGALMLLIFDVLYFIKTKDRKFRTVYIFVILSVVSLILSFVFAINKDLAISGADLHAEGIFVFMAYLVIFLSATLIEEDKNRRIIYYVMTVIGVFEVILGVMQAIIHPSFLKETLEELYFEDFKAFGTLENPNPFGSVMAVYLSFETILTICSTGKNRFLHAILAGIYAYGMFLSGTRGAMLGYAAAMLFFAIIFLIRRLIKKNCIFKQAWLGILLVIVAVGISLLLFYLTSRTTFENVTGRVADDVTSVVSENVEELGSSRILIWKKTLETYSKHNLFFGMGISNLVQLVRIEDFNLLNYDAHNRYLHILCTMGIFGVVVYLSFAIYIFIIAMKKLFNHSTIDRKYVLALIAAYSAYMAADAFSICVYALPPFLYLIMGLLLKRNQYGITKDGKNTETIGEIDVRV